MKVSAKAAPAAATRSTASAVANTPARRRFTPYRTLKPRCGCGPRSGIQVGERVHEYLRERGERLDGVAQRRKRHLGADRERCLLQPLARLGANRVRAHENAASPVCQQ